MNSPYWRKVLEDALKNEPCDIEKIEQIPADRYFDVTTTLKEERDSLFDKGLCSISKGEVAAVVLAGGQASRLGTNVPKGAYKLGLHFGNDDTDSLFYLHTVRLCRLIELAKEKFPESKPSISWMIMTSASTDAATRKHMDEVLKVTKFPKDDLTIFSQNEVPTLDFDGNFLLKTEADYVMNPDGNGGIYEAIRPHLPKLQERGIKYFHVFSVDNILNRPADPVFVGACILKDADCAAKVVEKVEPQEAVGNLCLENGRVRMLEYSEITPELANRRDENGKLFLRAGSIANHLFRVDFLKKVCKGDIQIPFHVAKKKVAYMDKETKELVKPTTPNAYKLERFIFDSFGYSNNLLVYQVAKNEEFSPLKNSNDMGNECLDTCFKDLSELNQKWVKAAGVEVKLLWTKRAFLNPPVTYEGEGLDPSLISVVKEDARGEDFIYYDTFF